MSSSSSTTDRGIYGDTTGELHTAWLNKVAATKAAAAAAVVEATGASSDLTRPETLPHEALQPLFNDVLLYPSKSQVFEMVQCARECSNQVRISVSPLRSSDTAKCEYQVGNGLIAICMSPLTAIFKASQAMTASK